MRRAARRKKALWKQAMWLLLLLIILTGTLYLRSAQASGAAAVPAAAERTEAKSPEETQTAPAEEGSEPTQPAAAEAPAPDETEAPAPPAEGPAETAVTYNETSYQLVSDMLQLYREDQAAALPEIQRLLEELKQENPGLGAAWEGIMDYWNYVNSDMEIHYGVLPEGLPRDDSLCIVVLGFQLQHDGAMASELVGRCETALACAQQYPNAYLALTGGGTALENKGVTEAGAMAQWFLKKGVAAERLIVEDASLTSAENAQFTSAILIRDYPQVRTLAIVSSDYHIALGSLLFTETALLHACETGQLPFAVISNAAYAAPAREESEGVKKQAQYLWTIADPSL